MSPVSPTDLHPRDEPSRWSGLAFEVPSGPPSRSPVLRVEYAHRGLFRVRRGSRTHLIARLEGWFTGLWWSRPVGRPESLGVLRPIRAEEARRLAGDLRAWAWRFHDELRRAENSILYPGSWRIEAPSNNERSFGGQPHIHRVERCLSQSGGFSEWDLNGSDDVFALRQPSSCDAGRVNAWRKSAREGNLPPVLLFFVSGMDSCLLVDGHDRLQAALLERVTPLVLRLSSFVEQRWTHDPESTARIERSLALQIAHANTPERIDAVNQRLILLHADPSQIVSRTRAWPVAGGSDAWQAEARGLVAQGAPPELPGPDRKNDLRWAGTGTPRGVLATIRIRAESQPKVILPGSSTGYTRRGRRKPRVACHWSANTIEIARDAVSSVLAESHPTQMPAKHPCRQAAAQAASSNRPYQTFFVVAVRFENGV